LIKANAWGKYQIRGINWLTDRNIPNALIIAAPEDVTKKTIILKVINKTTTYNVLSVNDAIISAPNYGAKYVLIETNKNKTSL
jgi:hypothetical protein